MHFAGSHFEQINHRITQDEKKREKNKWEKEIYFMNKTALVF